ncbi:hypothetical protein ABT115_08820 [Streptomyces sp. NPDC001832]|uniref:hypothetical protein n=1 Tax=Streptomyces sp. NPDC001832 TaxID=3154527 RepID=UPI00331CF242
MKRFGFDADELSEKATYAAWLDTPAERLHALTGVFQECGERANAYHDPMFVARVLVKEVTFVFRFERTEMLKNRMFQGV